MKFKLKMVAVAAALASLAGGAHADLTTGTTQNNGSFSLLAFNIVTNDWYIRDLGFLMNSFLPTGITTSVADNNAGVNSGSAATGDRTPSNGLLLNGGPSSPNFTDASFATWLGTQNNADVRWMVGSYDISSVSATGSQRRLIASSTNAAEDFLNSQLDSFTGTGQWGGLANYFNAGTDQLSVTGIGMQGSAALNAFGSGVALATVGQSANLFYAVRSTFTGSTTSFANTTAYGNGAGLATVTLEADGDFIYSLGAEQVAAVPLPAAVWMMGAGLMALGGAARRRRAAAAA